MIRPMNRAPTGVDGWSMGSLLALREEGLFAALTRIALLWPATWSQMAGKKGTAGPRSGLSATSIRAWQAGDSAWSAPQPGRDQRPQRSRCPASSAYSGNLSSMEMSVASCVSAVAIISRSWGAMVFGQLNGNAGVACGGRQQRVSGPVDWRQAGLSGACSAIHSRTR